MAYFNTCPRCGAHNDPGESCDCDQKLVFDHYDYADKRGVVKKQKKQRAGKAGSRIAVYHLF